MATYTEAVQKLYVAYFSRPADAAGLAYWENVVAKANGNTAAVSAAFAASQEYKDTFAGQSAYQIINTIYQNLFGRAAESAALTFWGQGLLNNNFTIDNAVTAIAAGAQGSDLVAYNSKVAAATAFTAALDTSAEMIGYNGTAANNAAKVWLAGITTDAQLKAAIEPAALNGTVIGVTNPPVVGQTFALSAGADTITGTSANDVINALSVNATGADTTTFSTFDKIDGGAGNDTLNIYTTNADNEVFPASGTVTNVETINIYNAQGAAALADASQFVGATQIWQIGAAAANVTKLGASTTAGFEGTTAGALTVSAAGATAAAAFKGVDESVTLAFNGATLSGVTVSGTRVDGADLGTSVARLALNVTAGKDVQTVTVNSAVSTTLTVANAATSTKALTTVDASASAGSINYDASAATAVRTIKTGAAGDTVTIATATAVDASATTTVDETISATVSTGAGNDTVNVNTTGEGLTNVDAGAGNDTINVSTGSQNVTITAGAGDDFIDFNRGVGAKDVVNGGDGTDYLEVQGTSLIAQDYEILRAVVSNVEGLSLAQAAAGVDASKLTQFSEFTVNADGTSIVKVADAQSIVTYGDVVLTAAGYAGGSATTGASATYAGTLNVYAEGGAAADATTVPATAQDNLVVNAHANAIVLDVAATAATSTTAGAASFVELMGDVKTATVNLTNSVNAATSATATGDAVATFVLTTSSAAAAAAGSDAAGFTNNGALTSLTLTGNGQAIVTNNAGSKLASIDASGMTGVAAYDATAKVGGLNFTGLNTLAETVKLGGGKDIVTTASTYNAVDTITGLTLVAGTTAGTVDHAKSDDLSVAGLTNFAKTTVTGATLGLALTDAASKAGNSLVFTYGGDTYIFVDNANTAIDASNTVGSFGTDDVVVKLTGTVDLDLLTLILNGNGGV